MPRGIRAMNEWTVNMERGQGNDRHLQVNATIHDPGEFAALKASS